MIDREARRIVDTHVSEPTNTYDDRDFVPLIESIHDFVGQEIVSP